MGYKIMWEIVNGVDARLLGQPAMHCLIILGKYADDETRMCWPSTSRIAEDMGCDRKTVMKCTRKLQKKGFIGVERKNGGGNKYRLHPKFESFSRKEKPEAEEDVDLPEYPGVLEDDEDFA